MSEQWKTIKGWPEYAINPSGRIRRILYGQGVRPERILKHRVSPGKRRGYPYVSFCRGGYSKNFYVHCLVAETFLGDRPPGKQINHKDGNKLNCQVSNLEYLTCSENHSHAIRIGLKLPPPTRRGEDNHQTTLTASQVLLMRELIRNRRISWTQAARRFRVCHATVWNIISRRTWKHI